MSASGAEFLPRATAPRCGGESAQDRPPPSWLVGGSWLAILCPVADGGGLTPDGAISETPGWPAALGTRRKDRSPASQAVPNSLD